MDLVDALRAMGYRQTDRWETSSGLVSGKRKVKESQRGNETVAIRPGEVATGILRATVTYALGCRSVGKICYVTREAPVTISLSPFPPAGRLHRVNRIAISIVSGRILRWLELVRALLG